jgi:hypothetical protein
MSFYGLWIWLRGVISAAWCNISCVVQYHLRGAVLAGVGAARAVAAAAAAAAAIGSGGGRGQRLLQLYAATALRLESPLVFEAAPLGEVSYTLRHRLKVSSQRILLLECSDNVQQAPSCLRGVARGGA